MKIVFIATDFSPASHNASLYAIEFAKAFNAKVILYHAYQAIYLPVESMILAPSDDIKENCENALWKEAEKLNPDGTLDIEVLAEEAFIFHETILTKAKEEGASIIFMGMKNERKGLMKILGSTCCALGIRTKIPVIIVPEDAVYDTPDTIALASDIDDYTDYNTLNPLKEIGERFNSKLFITRVVKKDMDETVERLLRPTRLKYYLSNLNPEYVFINDNNVVEGLNKFVSKNKAKMIAMVPHQHDILERVFTKSNTQSMIFHTNVPLLILPESSNELQKKTRMALAEVY